MLTTYGLLGITDKKKDKVNYERRDDKYCRKVQKLVKMGK